MITHKSLAQLCIDIYDNSKWSTNFKYVIIIDGVCYGLVIVDDVYIIVFRGSKDLIDWRRDLDTFAKPILCAIGLVHPGFYRGLPNVWDSIKAKIPKDTKWGITAHSLGAAHAAGLTALAILDGRSPDFVVKFGEPKFGFQKFVDFIKPVNTISYRNGDEYHHDLITDVPYAVPALGLDYVRSTPFTVITAPSPKSDYGVFSWHHIDLYHSVMPDNEIKL